MKIEDFINSMGVLGTAYNKEFSQEQIMMWYEYFKAIKLYTFKQAIKNIIPRNKYLPSIAELLEECRITSKNQIEQILENMKKNDYFKTELELEKIYNWLEKGIIPSWLKEDMKMYTQRSLQINKTILLEEI